MALWVCLDCTTRYAVGAECCPHCRSTSYEEDGVMPKITRHGGPTIAGASVVGGSWSDEGDPDVWPEPEGSEESSPGSSSAASPVTPSPSGGPSETPRPSPARTTGSRSKRARTGSSSASGTAGGPETGTSATGSADE